MIDSQSKFMIAFVIFYAMLIFKIKVYNHSEHMDDGVKQKVKQEAVNVKDSLNTTIKKNLTCYQCYSHPQYKISLCDTQYWKLTSAKNRHKYTTECPAVSKFCVKQERYSKIKKKMETIRGCTGDKDNYGRTIRAGCIIVDGRLPNITETLCLCPTDLCNKATMNLFFNNYLILIILGLLYINYPLWT